VGGFLFFLLCSILSRGSWMCRVSSCHCRCQCGCLSSSLFSQWFLFLNHDSPGHDAIVSKQVCGYVCLDRSIPPGWASQNVSCWYVQCNQTIPSHLPSVSLVMGCRQQYQVEQGSEGSDVDVLQTGNTGNHGTLSSILAQATV
jgi:hypothetical protein